MAPNPIDFDKVWENFGKLAETGNFVVLATVCSIFGVYFIGLVFARRADKNDEMKVGYCVSLLLILPFRVNKKKRNDETNVLQIPV